MAKMISIQQYDQSYCEKWDKFVLEKSANGTFLQTRRFLSYHPEKRFEDNSLIFFCGTDIVAVLPAHINKDEESVLSSHKGSTFGGLVIGKQFCKINYLDMIFEAFEEYIRRNGIDEVILKQTGRIYQNKETEILDYYLFMNGYTCAKEMGYFIDFSQYEDDIISNFTSSRRRDYRYSLKNRFRFAELIEDKEIREFYRVLCDNYKKFGKQPIHTIEELIDFKFSRLAEHTRFYGVYHEDEMIASAMIFTFDKKVFHTQYLAVCQNQTNMFANEFLYTNLIHEAKGNGFEMISFGTSTFDEGRILNRPLAQYKEGFGTSEYVNHIYKKHFSR